jgi:hypothetical protein
LPAALVSFVGPSAATWIAVASMPAPSTLIYAIAIVASVAPGLVTVDQLARAHQRDDEAQRERRRRIAEPLIEQVLAVAVRTVSATPDKTGAILFLPDATGVLCATFTYNKDRKPDRNIVFEERAGATGHAWWSGEQTVADLSAASEADLERTWKLTSEQVRVTAHVKAIVSTVLWSSTQPRRKLGVLSIDCEEPMDACRMSSDDALEVALSLARTAAYVLELADLV